jgi:hypothetical protein
VVCFTDTNFYIKKGFYAMKVFELIEQLQNCNPNAEVSINGNEEISAVWNCPLSAMVDITSAPIEDEIDNMERDDFFISLAEETEKSEAEIAFDEMMGGMGEMLDAMKINGVR